MYLDELQRCWALALGTCTYARGTAFRRVVMHSLGTPAVKLQNPAVNMSQLQVQAASLRMHAPLDSAKRTTSAHHYKFEPTHLFLRSSASSHHQILASYPIYCSLAVIRQPL